MHVDAVDRDLEDAQVPGDVTMIDEALERMCQFNDQEIRRKGKLLMAKVGRRWEAPRSEASRLQSASEM